MAHLHCEAHARRTLVFDDGNGHTVVAHRSDGGDCDGRYVSIGDRVFDPIANRGIESPTVLGPSMLRLDNDVAKRIIKSKRRVTRSSRLWLSNAPVVERDC
jgi:hypothetical protein